MATVVAAKEEPGWHGDRYVNEDKTVAKGWQEIEGKSYYFSEDGTVNSSKTEKATTASVSSNITGEVKETVATASQEAVKEEAIRSGSFYVNSRWLGGTLTNFKTIQKRIRRIVELENMEKDGTFDLIPKKEGLDSNHGMIFTWPVILNETGACYLFGYGDHTFSPGK